MSGDEDEAIDMEVEDVEDDSGATSPAAGFTLQKIRDEMTPQGVRRRTRAVSTFKKRTAANEIFILWLYNHHGNLLHQTFRETLDDISTDPDYSPVTERRKKYTGKKTIEERKEEYLNSLMREEINNALGDLGQEPPQLTVNFDQLCENVDVFLEYLCDKKKANGGLMKPSVYKDYRSGLTFLFRRYRYTIPKTFEDDLSECMKGVKRISNEARQKGEVRK